MVSQHGLTVVVPFARTAEAPVNLVGPDPLGDYYRSAIVSLASFRRHTPSAELLFATNSMPPPDFVAQFRNVGAAISLIPFAHCPPDSFSGSFKAAQYLVDAILSVRREHAVLFVDPDVLCLGRPSLPSNSLGAYVIKYPENYQVNGRTPQELALLADRLREVRPSTRQAVPYVGGEAVLVAGPHADEFVRDLDATWRSSMNAFHSGLPFPVTEEHMISIVLADLEFARLNGTVRRIWTTRTYRTSHRSDRAVPIWHLPAEKGRVFQALYRELLDDGSWFWTADDESWSNRVADLAGASDGALRRLFTGATGALASAAFAALGRRRAARGIFR